MSGQISIQSTNQLTADNDQQNMIWFFFPTDTVYAGLSKPITQRRHSFINLEQVIYSARKVKEGKFFLEIVAITEQQFIPTLVISVAKHSLRSNWYTQEGLRAHYMQQVCFTK